MAERSPQGTEELRLQVLVLRCQTGDEQAFAQLFREYGQRTLAYLRGLVGDAADDVQQDVWLAVYRSIRSLTNARAFRTWLFRTTRHRAIDYLRSRRRERELLEGAALEAAAAGDAELDDTGAQFDEADLAAALEILPTAQREVLLLRYRDDLSYAEIALVVGCAIGTVRSRLHHARLRLQELIAQNSLRPQGANINERG